MNGDRPGFAAVVVTFFPDEGIVARLKAIARECAVVIVVDNGSGPLARGWLERECVELIALPENRGLAAALNTGLNHALSLGFEWAVTFDQDSTPEAGMADALWRSRQSAADPASVAVVGPRLREEHVRHDNHRWVVGHRRCSCFFRRVSCGDTDLIGVAFVITSGALICLNAYRRIGPMAEELFIDYIDHDYCLRARRAGYEIVVSADAWLTHNLGAQREFRVAGRSVYPTFHSPLRLRYIARNRWTVWRRHAKAFPYWAAYDAVWGVLGMVRMLVFENDRTRKMKALIIGSWDGLCGRTGRIFD